MTIKGKIENDTSDLDIPIGIAIAWTNEEQGNTTDSWFKIEGKSYIISNEFIMAMESSEEMFESYGGESSMKFGTGMNFFTKDTLFIITYITYT